MIKQSDGLILWPKRLALTMRTSFETNLVFNDGTTAIEFGLKSYFGVIVGDGFPESFSQYLIWCDAINEGMRLKKEFMLKWGNQSDEPYMLDRQLCEKSSFLSFLGTLLFFRKMPDNSLRIHFLGEKMNIAMNLTDHASWMMKQSNGDKPSKLLTRVIALITEEIDQKNDGLGSFVLAPTSWKPLNKLEDFAS